MIKKILYISVLSVLMLGLLTGCGKDGQDGGKDTGEDATVKQEVSNIDVAAQTIVDTLLTEGEFKEPLSAIDNNMALTRLYMLDATMIEDAVFYTSSGATAEEIAVIKVNDTSYIDTVKSAFDTRIADQKSAFTDYVPAEVPKLDDAVIYTNGNYAILCVSSNSSKIDEAIAAIFQ